MLSDSQFSQFHFFVKWNILKLLKKENLKEYQFEKILQKFFHIHQLAIEGQR